MDRLWAPWRIKYVASKRQKRCIFCQGFKSNRKHYVVFRTRHCFSMLNTFPYNNGHLLIAPIRHIRELSQLREEEAIDLFRTINSAKKMLDKALRPQGYNIGINISQAAGAGITGHLHIHIVPRWAGDTNFMPVLNDTKIIAQSLGELYKRLKKHAESQAH